MADSATAGAGTAAGRRTPRQAADLEAARGATRRGGRTADVDPGTPADLAVKVVGQLFRLAPRLEDLQDRGAREYGLGFARGRVLWALLESGPIVMRALSEALRISPRTVTGLVDALEADGWVTRSPHPGDRRATIISLTAESQRTLPRLRDHYEGLARDLLGDLSADDLASCHEVIGTLEERLDAVVVRRTAAYERAGTAAGRSAGSSSPRDAAAGSAPAAERAGQAGRRARS